ncbi:MAG: hypothetical protein EA409_01840 [Saprospirales bacterium]|nr:MAG: hypothetical protein EA409_01840 [Saprospirales bacterium]
MFGLTNERFSIAMQTEVFLRLFQIKEVELPDFLKLLGHSFFNALGIALSFSAINIHLIDQHGIGMLPLIYFISGFLLLLSGRLYSIFEAKLPPVKLFAFVLVFCMVWALGARAVNNFPSSLELIVLFYALYLVVYQLSNLEFWGVASLLYDVRQSKRLFGLLTTGESVGKVLGYLFTPIIVVLFSIQDLFTFAAISFGLSFVCLYLLSRGNSEKLEIPHDHHHSSQDHKHEDVHRQSGFKVFGFLQKKLKDPFFRLAGIFAMLSTLVLYLIHYSFLERVEVHFNDVDQLAIFFGFFFSFGKLLNLLKKTILFSRLFWRLKIGQMILILPVTLGIVTLVGLMGLMLVENNLIFLLWIFGLLMLLDEIIRSSIHLPAYFILFQPLDKHRRLESHTLAKGYMEPIGLGFSGLILLSLSSLGIFELKYIIICLTAAIGLWIICGYYLGKKYSELIHFLLKNRLLSSDSMIFTREEMSVLEDQVKLGSDSIAVLYKLKLSARDLSVHQRHKMVIQLLEDHNPLVVAETIDIIAKIRDERYLPYIRVLIDHPNERVSRKAIFMYCSLVQAESVQELQDDIKSAKGAKKENLIAGILKYAGIYGATNYGGPLLAWVDSPDPAERLSAARIIGLVEKKEFYHPLIKLLKDPDRRVKGEAIYSTSKVGNRHLIPHLIDIAISGELYKAAVNALEAFGDEVVPYLKSELEKAHHHLVLNRLIKIAGSISGNQSISLLEGYLSDPDFELRETAVYSLFKRNFVETEPEKIELLRDLIQLEHKTFNHLTSCLGRKVISPELRHSIISEIRLQQLRVLRILALIYGKSLIQKAEDSLLMGDHLMNVNAIELLENNISSHLSNFVSPILEFKPESASDWLRSDWEMGKTDLLSCLLNTEKLCVSHWLCGLLIREYNQHQLPLPTAQLKLLREVDSDIIQQELSNYNNAYGISD